MIFLLFLWSILNYVECNILIIFNFQRGKSFKKLRKSFAFLVDGWLLLSWLKEQEQEKENYNQNEKPFLMFLFFCWCAETFLFHPFDFPFFLNNFYFNYFDEKYANLH